MQLLYLTDPHTQVRRKDEHLEVWEGESRKANVPLQSLERIVVFGSVPFTSQALALALDKGIDVSFLSGHGKYRGSLLAAQSKNVFLRLAQCERFRHGGFRLAFCRAVVTAKILAQQRVLTRYARSQRAELESRALEELARLLGQVAEAGTPEGCQGLEGQAAAVYFEQFRHMLTALEFPGRRQRPSTDPANALLSLGYVMLGNEIASLLEALGLDPAVGFLHGLRYGRQSLALDLVEPFRQPVIDRLTLRLLNLKQFTSKDFEGGEKGLRLVPEALKRYLEEYERHLRSSSEGEGSPSWRERLKQQAEAVRAMVMNDRVEPLWVWDG
ncbi:MAG: CRISPR-associated endonuclease Cas1 [Thermoanaerobaculia bacterium]